MCSEGRIYRVSLSKYCLGKLPAVKYHLGGLNILFDFTVTSAQPPFANLYLQLGSIVAFLLRTGIIYTRLGVIPRNLTWRNDYHEIIDSLSLFPFDRRRAF